MSKDLEALREELDRVDEQMVQLFQERMALCAQVANYKKEHGLPDRKSVV